LHGKDIACSHGEYYSEHIVGFTITLPTVFCHIHSNIRTLFLQAHGSAKAAILSYQLCTLEGRTLEEIDIGLVQISYFEKKIYFVIYLLHCSTLLNVV
jgi:hypothetical protein